MAKYIREIMNRELFTVTPQTRIAETLTAILDLGITAVPVLDNNARPVGVVSLRDLVRVDGAKAKDASTVMSTPAVAIPANALIEDAARAMSDKGLHHLIVVGSDGCAVGMLSSIDLLRAMIGDPIKHPASFPHYDTDLEVAWTDLELFDREHANKAPEGAGVLVIASGGSHCAESDLCAIESLALRSRLQQLLDDPGHVREIDGHNKKNLRFRCATISDANRRTTLLRRLRERINGAPLPRSVGLVESDI